MKGNNLGFSSGAIFFSFFGIKGHRLGLSPETYLVLSGDTRKKPWVYFCPGCITVQQPKVTHFIELQARFSPVWGPNDIALSPFPTRYFP